MSRTLTAPGWPRPRIGGLPIPWVSPAENLSQQDIDRALAVKQELLCQVCGEGHPAGAEVVVFLNGALRTEGGEPMDRTKYSNVLLRAIDDAIMHERCARLAAGSCPRLKALRAEGNLWPFAGSIELVDEYDDPNEKGATYLALQGAGARVFEL